MRILWIIQYKFIRIQKMMISLMGNPKYTEKDQLAVANVSISSNNDVFSKRKINFFSKGIEIVVDTINQSKK